MLDDVADANRLVAFGFRPGLRPPQLAEYRDLAGRYLTDAGFAQVVHAAVRGFDLTIITVDPRAGIVLGPTLETPFAASIADHVPNTRDRPLVLLAHLAIAALAFPRAADLDDGTYVGRITVDQVDEAVTDAAVELSRRVAESGENGDPPADQPDLVALWRYFLRRNSVGQTVDGRALSTSRRGLIKRAAEYLADNGMLRRVSSDAGGTYSTTIRYQIQVRELAATQMLGDLAELGIAMPGGGPVPPFRPGPGETPA
jgi:hypothetical protein